MASAWLFRNSHQTLRECCHRNDRICRQGQISLAAQKQEDQLSRRSPELIDLMDAGNASR
jgi:hypothetical protein